MNSEKFIKILKICLLEMSCCIDFLCNLSSQNYDKHSIMNEYINVFIPTNFIVYKQLS